MRKIIILAGLMTSLAACGGKKTTITLPAPPQTTTVVQQNIPVPVLCTVEIGRAKTALDDAKADMKLEEQNATFRQTIAQKEAYIVALESGIIGCGGKVVKK
jgi:hypothetical protein